MILSGEFDGNLVDGADTAVPDSVLLVRVRQGDEAAWSALVRCHQEPVFRLAYLMLADERDRAAAAEDVAQETFIRAYRKLDQFAEERPLRPWLLAIAANLARNRRRSLGRYWSVLKRWTGAIQDEWSAAARTLDERDDARLLWEAIQRLSAKHQQAIYLRYFLDMAEGEMAQVLDVSPGTVKSRLYRARQALLSTLEEKFPILYREWQAR